MPETQIKIERLREALRDFVWPQKEGKEFAKQNEINDVFRDMRSRFKTVAPLKDTDYFEDAEFYVFRRFRRK